MLKKLMLVLIMVMAATPAFAAGDIADMDQSHWAYDSVKKLVDQGYLALYEDHSFRGDQPLTRTVFAAAFAKLLDQLEKGQFKSGADIKEIKKSFETINSNISEYDTKFSALEQKVKDIESGKVVISMDLSKATVEFRDKFDKLTAENEQLKRDVDMLQQQLATVSDDLKKETSKRKSATSSLWIGVVAAIAVGAASN